MGLLPRSLRRLQQEAKALSKRDGIPHTAALELVARSYGFANWKAILRISQTQQSIVPEQLSCLDELEGLPTQTPSDGGVELVHTPYLVGLTGVVRKNQEFLASQGVEFALFEPTGTGLRKSILDATHEVRSYLALNNFHDYLEQGQGKDSRVKKDAFLLSTLGIQSSLVSLYRPLTKQGDPRMWFSGLSGFAVPGDVIALIVFENALYLLNLSQMELAKLPQNSPPIVFISKYLRKSLGVAEELLAKLREIAKSPIKVAVKGNTAVGMAVEAALGISANSRKEPDYKGIEIKSGRGGANRTTLFAQVPNWSISSCKSSAQILNRYGYGRGDDFKLYCTISTRKPNSQGLQFVYDARRDYLIEKDSDFSDVATWPAEVLRQRLIEKHGETFWIEVRSTERDGEEYFELLSVTHTMRPIISQLIPLIVSGVITMDHLIKRKGGEGGRVSEKGPLFKINKKDLPLLFPEPRKYSLK